VIEWVPSPAEIVAHVVVERRCPRCRRRVVPTLDLGGQVVGRQRLGVGLLALIATLREKAELPVGMIQWYLATLHQVHLSVGAIVAASRLVAEPWGTGGRPDPGADAREPTAFHADETGWRQNGQERLHLDVQHPDRTVFPLRRARTKGMVDLALGDAFSGVLISDFYKAYDHVGGPKQRCWAHLLRDAHLLRTQHPRMPACRPGSMPCTASISTPSPSPRPPPPTSPLARSPLVAWMPACSHSLSPGSR